MFLSINGGRYWDIVYFILMIQKIVFQLVHNTAANILKAGGKGGFCKNLSERTTDRTD